MCFSMKKIIAFTAIRSEYDLLSGVYKLLSDDQDIDFRLIVSGSHLSKNFGYTVSDIEKDNIPILARIETLINSDSKASRIKSTSILLQNAIDIVCGFSPDLIIYAGDREEVPVAALIGGYLEIPTIHFFGGDHAADSHIDNSVRHATSKLSTAHFVSNEEHSKRLIKMGEASYRVFNIGSVALDKYKNESIIPRADLLKKFNVSNLFNKFAIVIFHPVPKERKKSAEIFENILQVLESKNIQAFVSFPNIDPGNSEIIGVIDKYRTNDNFLFYKNQPRNIFISIYRHAEFIIGNSSSGILESASIPIPAINVGYRQTGRLGNNNVLFVDGDSKAIDNAVNTVCTDVFKEKIKNIRNIFGDGDSSRKAYELIKDKDFSSLVYKNEDALNE